MSVIRHDFGLKDRKAARRFTALLSLDALHEANVRANPLPYLERASERIYQLERTLFEAAQAASRPADAASTAESIEVSKAEYQRLVDCRAIVEAALAQLVTRDDDVDAMTAGREPSQV